MKQISRSNNSSYRNANVGYTKVDVKDIEIVDFDSNKMLPDGNPVFVKLCDYGAYGVTLDLVYGDKLRTKVSMGKEDVHLNRDMAFDWIESLKLPYIENNPNDRFASEYGVEQDNWDKTRKYTVHAYGAYPTHAVTAGAAFAGLKLPPGAKVR